MSKKTRKEKNHFIVNEQEKFPTKFVFNMIFMSFLVLVLAFGYVGLNIFKVNANFTSNYKNADNKLRFDSGKFIYISEQFEAKDVEQFLSIYLKTDDKDFNKKMDKVLREYNSKRASYISGQDVSPDKRKKINEVSWYLANSLWNYKYNDFGWRANTFYNERNLKNTFIDYMRSRFFIENTKLLTTGEYDPKTELDKSSQDIQSAVNKAIKEKDYQFIIILVAQINIYYGYVDTLSEYFVNLYEDTNIPYMVKDGGLNPDFSNVPFYDEIMFMDREHKGAIMAKGTMGQILVPDNYLENMWNVVLKKSD